MPELAVVVRGGFVESRHAGSVVVLGRDGTELLRLGDPDAVILPRSTLKPVQAEGCLLAGAPLAGEEVAVAAGSHTGRDDHATVVARVLARVGLTEDALGCPPDWPEDEPTRRRLTADGGEPSALRMNCSGKHAAMLAACVHRGWDTDGYLDADHPLQGVVRDAVETATGEPVAHVTVDGCGAPLFGVTLLGLARAFHRLATSPPRTAAGVVAEAMRAHPTYVGGDPHPNSDAMRRVPGLLAKGGAEGVIGMAAATGESVAVKVADGNPRATTLIALSALAAAGVDVSGAASLLEVPILGGGRPVGGIALGADLAALVGGR